MVGHDARYLRRRRVERIYRKVKVIAIDGRSEEIMRDLAARQLASLSTYEPTSLRLRCSEAIVLRCRRVSLHWAER